MSLQCNNCDDPIDSSARDPTEYINRGFNDQIIHHHYTPETNLGVVTDYYCDHECFMEEMNDRLL